MEKDDKGSRVSVFKGRTRSLTKAIFWTLALKGPCTIYDIRKAVRAKKRLRYTRYSVVLRRVKTLLKRGYLEKVGTRRTKAGFEAPLYQLTTRAYLAIMVRQVNLYHLIEEADEDTVLAVLGFLSSIL
jgi:hypothetical protein